jgi:hypothetical protein
MTTYGIVVGEDADFQVTECESRQAAEIAALVAVRNGAESADVVELEGSGPFYADDGTLIAPTHAPARTLLTVTRSTAATLGRKGGSVTSPAKRQASRANGALGGRPRRHA